VAQLSGASESLLLPLVSRALESRAERPLVHDPKALEILGALDYDFRRVAPKTLYHTQISLRVRHFDEAVAAFLAHAPEGVVVNLGCGLDTRYDRLDNGRAEWLEVDLPAAIELRRRLLAEGPRRRFVAASLADPGWLVEAARGWRGRRCFFLAEGVLMFLEAVEVRRLFADIAHELPGSEILFDALRPLEVWGQRFHPTLRSTRARLRWGLSRGRDLEHWGIGARVLDEWFYCDQDEPRLGAYRALRWARFLATARVLRVRLGS
jgi:methyltransferase (TIGR00027 family)